MDFLRSNGAGTAAVTCNGIEDLASVCGASGYPLPRSAPYLRHHGAGTRQGTVADHGEMLTAEREVEAMCNLVKQETERIDSRLLI